MKTAIVTDSTADLPPEILAQYQIGVIPTYLVMEGTSLPDGAALDRAEFYRQLPTMPQHPTTAAPSVGEITALFEKFLQHGYTQIVAIHLSSTLSNTCNHARVAAQAFAGRVQVLDSRQISLGLGFQVLAAARAAQRGETVTQIVETANRIRERVHVVAMLDTLEYVRRSGRVSWARATLGNLLQIKPFVELRDGEVLRLEQARTRHKGLARLLYRLQTLQPLSQLGLLHSNAEQDARAILHQLQPELAEPPLLVQVTPVLGNHVGPNGVGFAAVTR
ncbi:MAG: DegV family protein [Anaerolineales bacterium]